MRHWQTGVAAVVAAALLSASLVQGQDRSSRKTEIQVLAIRATNKNTEISPELREIADELKRQFKFTGFKLERRATGSVGIDEAFRTPLLEGWEARVTPKENDTKRVKLQIEIAKGNEKPDSATVTVPLGKFQLMGGQRLENGDSLIVAVAGR